MIINWQPIATAPSDGTDVIVYDGYDIWKAYCWLTVWYESSTQNRTLFHEPTHWLPISDLLQPLGHLP